MPLPLLPIAAAAGLGALLFAGSKDKSGASTQSTGGANGGATNPSHADTVGQPTGSLGSSGASGAPATTGGNGLTQTGPYLTPPDLGDLGGGGSDGSADPSSGQPAPSYNGGPTLAGGLAGGDTTTSGGDTGVATAPSSASLPDPYGALVDAAGSTAKDANTLLQGAGAAIGLVW